MGEFDLECFSSRRFRRHRVLSTFPKGAGSTLTLNAPVWPEQGARQNVRFVPGSEATSKKSIGPSGPPGTLESQESRDDTRSAERSIGCGFRVCANPPSRSERYHTPTRRTIPTRRSNLAQVFHSL